MKKILILVALLFSSNLVLAQGNLPVDDFSVGTEIIAGQNSYGVIGNYALKQNMHIGLQLGMFYDGGYEGSNGQTADGSTLIYLGGYFKYYFQNIRNMMPFVRVGAQIVTEENRNVTLSRASPGPSGAVVGRFSDHTDFYIAAGGTWFPFNNLAIHTGVRFFEFNTSISNIKVGLGNPFIGVDFYL